MNTKYYYVVCSHITNGAKPGYYSLYINCDDGILDIDQACESCKEAVEEDFGKGKIDVVVTNFIEVTKEFYLYNTKMHE